MNNKKIIIVLFLSIIIVSVIFSFYNANKMYCLELEDGNSLLVGQNGVVALAAFTSVLLVIGFAIKPSTAFAAISL